MVHFTVSNTNEERHIVVFNVFLGLRAFEISHSKTETIELVLRYNLSCFSGTYVQYTTIYISNQIMSCFSAVRGKTMHFESLI